MSDRVPTLDELVGDFMLADLDSSQEYSVEEIRQHRRKVSKKLHPDLYPPEAYPDKAIKFKEINRALDELIANHDRLPNVVKVVRRIENVGSKPASNLPPTGRANVWSSQPDEDLRADDVRPPPAQTPESAPKPPDPKPPSDVRDPVVADWPSDDWRARRKGRAGPWLVGSLVVVILVLIIGVSGRHSGGPGLPPASSAPRTTPRQVQATPSAPTTTTLPAAVSTAFDFVPQFVPGVPDQSSYESFFPGDPPAFQTTVTSVSASGYSLSVSFSATAQPNTGGTIDDAADSCLEITGTGSSGLADNRPLLVFPIESSLAVNQPLESQGILSFPLLSPGTYGFDFGCDAGFSPLINLGTANGIPIVGVSIGPEDGVSGMAQDFAAVFEVRQALNEVVLLYAAAGDNTLANPNQSCLVGSDGNPIGGAPIVNNTWSADVALGGHSEAAVVGTMTFPVPFRPGTEFEFACGSQSYEPTNLST